MNKIRNHAIGASITALTLAAVVLTGCAETPAECEDYDAASMTQHFVTFPDKVGGTSGGGSRGGSVSRPAAPAPKPNLNKPAASKPGAGGSSSGGNSSTGGGKAKAPKVKIDTDDCEVND